MQHWPLNKPKAVLFQFKYLEGVTSFQRIHRDEQVACLGQFFDLTVIDHDCDYQQVCDRIEPEVTLFETGLEIADSRRLKIRSVSSRVRIPRVGILNSDGCSEFRPGIASDIDHWRIDTLFSISLVAEDHLRGVTDVVYVWPNFINPNVFMDYRQPKNIPVLLTGSLNSRYPWRKAIHKELLGQVPTMWYPHFGYTARLADRAMVVGEEYARIMNAARLIPTCGSVTNELVRKHLEIPAAMSCLLTQASPAVAAAGFVDMVNCVFVTPADVVEKVQYLLSHEHELADITRRGWELVHTKHTMAQRSQVFEWFNMNRIKRPGQVIVQRDPFAALELVEQDSFRGAVTPHILSTGSHLAECDIARRCIAKRDYAGAEEAFRRCLGYLPEYPEAKLGLAYCRLRAGDPSSALSWIIEPLRTTLVRYRAEDPDPVEWSCFIVVLLCLGKLRHAVRRANQFSHLQHVELDRTRWLVGILRHASTRRLRESYLADRRKTGTAPPRASIHQCPPSTQEQWIRERCDVLRACGQTHYADVLRSAVFMGSVGAASRGEVVWRMLIRPTSWLWSKLIRYSGRPVLAGLDHPQLRLAISRRLKVSVRRALMGGAAIRRGLG